jgi:hypothetical protein
MLYLKKEMKISTQNLVILSVLVISLIAIVYFYRASKQCEGFVDGTTSAKQLSPEEYLETNIIGPLKGIKDIKTITKLNESLKITTESNYKPPGYIQFVTEKMNVQYKKSFKLNEYNYVSGKDNLKSWNTYIEEDTLKISDDKKDKIDDIKMSDVKNYLDNRITIENGTFTIKEKPTTAAPTTTTAKATTTTTTTATTAPTMEFKTLDGYLADGNESLSPAKYDLNQAKNKCINEPKCGGFTYKLGSDNTIYFF